MSIYKPPSKHFEDVKLKSNKSNNKPRKSKKSIPIAGECDCKIIESSTIDWYCTKGCGCLKINSKCSVYCECRGACSNTYNSITDELFFKVWRNIVLRKEIIGLKRIEIINQKENFKKELIETLNLYNIQYYESDIIQYTKLSSSSSIDSNNKQEFENVLNKYFQIERNKRIKILSDSIENYNQNHNPKVIYRPKSELILKFINTLLPDEQLKLPSIQEIINQELNDIQIIKDHILSLFIKENIGWMYRDETGYVPDFIQSGSTDYQSLIFQFRHLYRIYK